MAVAVESEPTFEPEKPKVLFQRTPVYSETFEGTGITWDSSPDGKRFLMLKEPETAVGESGGEEYTASEPNKIIVVTNWFKELTTA